MQSVVVKMPERLTGEAVLMRRPVLYVLRTYRTGRQM